MKVVHLSTTDSGGAYKATERISQCLKKQGVESHVLVRTRFHETDTVEIMDTPLKRILSKIRNGFNLLFYRGEIVADVLGADISRNLYVKEADIVFLHWVNSFVSVNVLRQLEKMEKPVIWVMHDMWVFTGGCHIDRNCGKYVSGCGNCPLLRNAHEKDRSYYNYCVKEKAIKKSKVIFVTLSEWEMNCAAKSRMLKEKEIFKIPNPLNINVFRPLNRLKLKKEKMDTSKRIVLFGADKATSDKNKGFHYLLEALKKLDGQEYCAVCFGASPEKMQRYLDSVEILYLGTIYDEKKLVEWYNIADVFVAPSFQESFGYTVCEALACGTPVAAFGAGGILDQVEHKRNGYIAKMKDASDLAEGIRYCADNRDGLTEYAREKVVAYNSYESIGHKYLELCNYKICENFRNDS